MNKLKTILLSVILTLMCCLTCFASEIVPISVDNAGVESIVQPRRWWGDTPKPKATYTYSWPDNYSPGVRNPPRKEVRHTPNAKPGEVIELSLHHPRSGIDPVVNNTAGLPYTVSHYRYGEASTYTTYYSFTVPEGYQGGTIYASQTGWSSVNNEGDRIGYGNIHVYITIPSGHTHSWSWTGDQANLIELTKYFLLNYAHYNLILRRRQ